MTAKTKTTVFSAAHTLDALNAFRNENGGLKAELFKGDNRPSKGEIEKLCEVARTELSAVLPAESMIALEDWLAKYYMLGYGNLVSPIRSKGTERVKALSAKTNKKAESSNVTEDKIADMIDARLNAFADVLLAKLGK